MQNFKANFNLLYNIYFLLKLLFIILTKENNQTDAVIKR